MQRTVHPSKTAETSTPRSENNKPCGGSAIWRIASGVRRLHGRASVSLLRIRHGLVESRLLAFGLVVCPVWVVVGLGVGHEGLRVCDGCLGVRGGRDVLSIRHVVYLELLSVFKMWYRFTIA